MDNVLPNNNLQNLYFRNKDTRAAVDSNKNGGAVIQIDSDQLIIFIEFRRLFICSIQDLK